MRIAILILSLLSAVSPLSVAQATGGLPCDQAIKQIVSEWMDGYNCGDAASVATLYREDAYYLTQHFITGIVHGRDAIQAYVQLGVDARYHVDSIQTLHTECGTEFGYAITRYFSTNAGQKAVGVNVVVLQPLGTKWMIVAHEAAVPDSATAIKRLSIPTRH